MKNAALIILFMLMLSTLSMADDDVLLSEFYRGATWSADSHKVYFSKWVKIVTRPKGSGAWGPPYETQYEKMFIYSYDVNTKKVGVVASMNNPAVNENSIMPPFSKFYLMANDHFSFCYNDDCFLADLTQRTIEKGSLGKTSNQTVKFTGCSPLGDIYFSLDRNSFIEIPTNTFSIPRINIFHNNNERSTILVNNFSHGCTTQKDIADNSSYVKNSISTDDLVTPEEVKIRNKFGVENELKKEHEMLQAVQKGLNQQAERIKQCEENEREKINSLSIEGFQSALANTEWSAKTIYYSNQAFYFDGRITFHSDGTYTTIQWYTRQKPDRYHGRWEVVDKRRIKLINEEDTRETYLTFDPSTGAYNGFLADKINIQGKLVCR